MLRPEAERQRRKTGDAALAVHDAVAVTAAFRPSLLRTRPATVTVDCSDDVTRGATVVTPAAPGAWTEIAVDAAEREIVDLIVRRVADYSW